MLDKLRELSTLPCRPFSVNVQLHRYYCPFLPLHVFSLRDAGCPSVATYSFGWNQYQLPLKMTTQNSLEIAQTAFALFKMRYNWLKPVHALAIKGINLVSENQPVQLDLFDDAERREKMKRVDIAVDTIRQRFGYRAIYAASLMGDLKMAQDKCETVIMPNYMYQ